MVAATSTTIERRGRIALWAGLAFLTIAPLIGLYPVFMMKALCYAIFACAFNLLLGFTGLLLGLVEGLTRVFYPEASSIVVFVIMAIVLMVRPAGLFGKEK